MKAFNPNSTFIYIVAGIVICFVLAQSIFFLIRSIKRAKQINMNMKSVVKTIGSTAIFTLAPAFSILLGVVTLSAFLGLPLPWIRLSVIGAITYELPAATSTANALGVSLSEMITDPKVYTAIAWEQAAQGGAAGPDAGAYDAGAGANDGYYDAPFEDVNE